MVACPRWMCFVLHVVGPLACASSIFPLFFFPPRPWLIPRLLSPLSPSMEVSIPSPPRQRSSLPWRTARLRAMSVFRRPAGWWHSSGAHPTPLKVQGGGAHMFGSTPPASCRRRLVGVLLCQPVYRTDASAPFCDAVHPPPPRPIPPPPSFPLTCISFTMWRSALRPAARAATRAVAGGVPPALPPPPCGAAPAAAAPTVAATASAAFPASRRGVASSPCCAAPAATATGGAGAAGGGLSNAPGAGPLWGRGLGPGGFSFPGARRLEHIVKLPLLTKLDGERVREVWGGFHADHATAIGDIFTDAQREVRWGGGGGSCGCGQGVPCAGLGRGKVDWGLPPWGGGGGGE